MRQKKRLVSVREAKASQVETLFETMRKQIVTLSSNRLTSQAMIDFNRDYAKYTSELENS